MFTKTLTAAAVAALVATAGVATAQNYVGLTMAMDENTTTISLPLVRADADGFVAIYEYNAGSFGELLGEEPINAGANTSVKINLGSSARTNVAAVIFAGPVTMPSEGVGFTEIEVQEMN